MPTEVAPLLTVECPRRAEARLKLEFPRALAELYRTVGNGGFGPGYGILGIDDGFGDDMGRTADIVYASFLEPDPSDPTWAWPTNLLPICHWSCAIYSCVDTSGDSATMVTWDPNAYESTVGVESGLRRGSRDLRDWLQAWGAGTELWDEMF